MNWQHLTLIVWLRWRLSYNQWRRAGVVNAFLTVGLVVAALVTAVVAFFVALVAGSLMLGRAEPDQFMLIWDLIIASFLFLWSMGVVTELQRTEFLSLDKLLHFPISPTGAFLLNYTSSLVSLAIVLFLPAMLGLCLASVITHGPIMLLLFPLLFGFVLVVTALTYQFRGWMATLMQNKRRRRTIVAAVTLIFIAMTQLPNLANLAFQQQRRQGAKAEEPAKTELNRQLESGEIDQAEYGRRLEELLDDIVARKRRAKALRWNRLTENLTLANLILPVGWLPYGAKAAAVGNPWPGLAGSLGLILLGSLSLWRSHRATMRLYTGQVRGNRPRRTANSTADEPITYAPFLERNLPGCSGQVSAVALAGWRNMVRAPEAKMALLSPLLIALIFGTMFVLGPMREMPDEATPFQAIGVIILTMFGMLQLLVNVFGNDRSGFRAFVLMPIPRRDILLGKNLTILPVPLVMSAVLIAGLQIFRPLSPTHLVATLIQLVPAVLFLCLIGNLTSIYAPMAVAAGSLKPVQPKFWPVMVHMASMMLMPLVLAPAVAALTVELLLDKFAGGRWFPCFLIVSLVELPIALYVYPRLVARQGALLQRRESQILEIVTANCE